MRVEFAAFRGPEPGHLLVGSEEVTLDGVGECWPG
jgi:hypothetical protein